MSRSEQGQHIPTNMKFRRKNIHSLSALFLLQQSKRICIFITDKGPRFNIYVLLKNIIIYFPGNLITIKTQ